MMFLTYYVWVFESLLIFGFISCNDRFACFTLHVKTCKLRTNPNCFLGYDYQIGQILREVKVTLNCDQGERVKVTGITYLLPADMDYYCNGKQNCARGTYSAQCTCCNLPSQEDQLCYHHPDMTQSQYPCSSTHPTCIVTVPRFGFTSAGCALKYGRYKRNCGVGDKTHCYSRWVKVTYDCKRIPIVKPPKTGATDKAKETGDTDKNTVTVKIESTEENGANSTSTTTVEENTLPIAVIKGITAGVVILLLLIIAVVVTIIVCVCRNRKNEKQKHKHHPQQTKNYNPDEHQDSGMLEYAQILHLPPQKSKAKKTKVKDINATTSTYNLEKTPSVHVTNEMKSGSSLQDSQVPEYSQVAHTEKKGAEGGIDKLGDDCDSMYYNTVMKSDVNYENSEISTGFKQTGSENDTVNVDDVYENEHFSHVDNTNELVDNAYYEGSDHGDEDINTGDMGAAIYSNIRERGVKK